VVPGNIRRKLGLQPGDLLEARIVGQAIVLTLRRNRVRKARIVRDEVTGLPVLATDVKLPKLTGAMVREILADFP